MKKSLLLASAALLAAGSMSAQRLQDGYVTWPSSTAFASYVSQWAGGSGTLTVNGKAFDDHNFFISRVKPRTRIQNTDTQIRPELVPTHLNEQKQLVAGTDKRLVFWVPISNEAKGSQKLNALPDGIFDGEMFSMWSYIDVYGNWNSPWGWTPGNFADVAHKNGVSVHGVASTPFGGLGTEWSNAYSALSSVTSDEVGKFLYYHGQDGLGYNSEFSNGESAVRNLISLHNGLKEYMKDRNPLWEVMWYGGTTDSGGCSFDQGVGSGGDNVKIYEGASIFLNYNWWVVDKMNSSIEHSINVGKDPFYIYAGHNMQGADPKAKNFDLLKDYAYSIGLWGAHAVNMLWSDRFANGGSDLAKHTTYQKTLEQWFGNGPRNPAIQLTPTVNTRHRPTDDWAGMSSMMSERSAINHNIATEPFITFFNLGNGFFFNWRGERQNTSPWHNIGVQDYLPTWRFWFAPEFAQKNVTPGTTGLDATFTWDDAYMGGSCLKITGTSAKEYLHLFRTEFIPGANNKIVIRYKLLNGEADINLVTSPGVIAEGATTLKAGNIKGSILTVANSADVCDASYDSSADDAGWQTKVINVSNANTNGYKSAVKGVGIIGLEFTNAKNLELLIGEFGWYPGAAGSTFDKITKQPTPSAPVMGTVTPLGYNNSGADVKFTWEMASAKTAGEPVYNTDVNTSVFRMYAQQEGRQPVNMGMTTSWAGICFSIPMDNSAASSRVRVGVSAVSVDYLTESAITWSDYQTLPAYKGTNAIELDKSILKTNQAFTISFVDPRHTEATWELTNATTNAKVWSATGTKVTCPGLAAEGNYNLEVIYGSNTDSYPNYVSISPDATGAIPEIQTMALAGTDTEEGPAEITIALNEPRTFAYTGRQADGVASRGVEFQGKWVGTNVGSLGIQANQSFSIAAWVYYPEFNETISNFITIENRAGQWPNNNWGYFWSRINKDGKFIADQIDTAWGCRSQSTPDGDRLFYRYDDTKIPTKAWTHVALVFEYSGSSLRQMFYVNGVLQTVGVYVKVNKTTAENILGSTSGLWSQLERLEGSKLNGIYGTNTKEPAFAPVEYPITSSDWIAFGGSAHDISSLEGYIDDLQIWGKAMTQSEVIQSMEGLDASNLPASVLGYWNFEGAADEENAFIGAAGSGATNKSPKAYVWELAAAQGEGQSNLVFTNPVFHAGSPLISGSYVITTQPTWDAGRKATVTGTGNDRSGSAEIQWSKPGDYTVNLTLANDHGSDSRTYPVVKVEDPAAAIGSVEADGADFTTYVESDVVFVEFAQDGHYSVDVYNLAGLQLASQQLSATAGQNAQITIGAPGVYLVKVVKDGATCRTVKVLVK